MSAGQIQALEELLARIQRNAQALQAERANGVSHEAQMGAAAAAEPELEPLESAPPPPEPELEPVDDDVMELGDDAIESIPPDELEEVSDELEEVRDSGEYAGGTAQRADALEPPEPELPSDLELELTEDLAEDEPPASSEKPLGEAAVEMPSSIGEAVERAASGEAPRTPPPESGPQVSIPPKDEYKPELAESDAPVSQHFGDGPTVAQLGGNTVELPDDEAEEPHDLELDAPQVAGSDHPDDEYEASLPERQFSGGYDHELEAPPNAREELEAHDRALRERALRESVPPVEGAPPPMPSGDHAGEAVARPAPAVNVEPALYEGERAATQTLSFVQRLDASLSLGKR